MGCGHPFLRCHMTSCKINQERKANGPNGPERHLSRKEQPASGTVEELPRRYTPHREERAGNSGSLYKPTHSHTHTHTRKPAFDLRGSRGREVREQGQYYTSLQLCLFTPTSVLNIMYSWTGVCVCVCVCVCLLISGGVISVLLSGNHMTWWQWSGLYQSTPVLVYFIHLFFWISVTTKHMFMSNIWAGFPPLRLLFSKTQHEWSFRKGSVGTPELSTLFCLFLVWNNRWICRCLLRTCGQWSAEY